MKTHFVFLQGFCFLWVNGIPHPSNWTRWKLRRHSSHSSLFPIIISSVALKSTHFSTSLIPKKHIITQKNFPKLNPLVQPASRLSNSTLPAPRSPPRGPFQSLTFPSISYSLVMNGIVQYELFCVSDCPVWKKKIWWCLVIWLSCFKPLHGVLLLIKDHIFQPAASLTILPCLSFKYSNMCDPSCH